MIATLPYQRRPAARCVADKSCSEQELESSIWRCCWIEEAVLSVAVEPYGKHFYPESFFYTPAALGGPDLAIQGRFHHASTRQRLICKYKGPPYDYWTFH